VKLGKLAQFLAPLVAVAVLVPATSALAKAKKKRGKAAPPACNLHYLPLVAGYSWTYASGQEQVEVKVTGVQQGKDEAGEPATLINVQETYGAQVQKTQWTCTAGKGLRISPDSFFFTGEPGASYGTQVTWTSHEDVWLHPDVNVVADSGWGEKLKGDVKRADTGGQGVVHPDAKLEVERYVVVKPAEMYSSAVWQGKAMKLEFQLRGRAMVGDEKQEIAIDDKNPGEVWLAKDVGVIKIKDNLKADPVSRLGGKTWELVASNVGDASTVDQ
jgi:hypothetical protein